MKTAISTACFHLKEETETALSLVRETGAEVCAVRLQTFYEYRPEFAKKYAQNLGGAEVCAIYTGAHNIEPQLFSPSRRIRGDGYYWLEQVLRSAQLLGAKRYVLKAPLLSQDENFKDNLQYLSAISGFCAGYGLTLCIENNPSGLLNAPSKIAEIKSACPGILFSFNSCVAVCPANSRQSYLKAMAGSLAQVVVDADTGFKELKKGLKNIGFDGEIVLETQNFAQISELEKLINSITKSL